jgi:hypothetical protein
MICPRCVVRTLAAQESAAAARTWHEHGVCTCPVIFPLGGAAARAGVLKTHLPAGALFRTVVVAATALQMNCVAGGGAPPCRARQHCHDSGTGSHLPSRQSSNQINEETCG